MGASAGLVSFEEGGVATAEAPTLTVLASEPGLVVTDATPDTLAEAATAEDQSDIERQLFNLSPRAREAVKQSSGLYDNRGRR